VSRHRVTITVNGERRQAEVEYRKVLMNFLRDDLSITSAHVGCATLLVRCMPTSTPFTRSKPRARQPGRGFGSRLTADVIEATASVAANGIAFTGDAFGLSAAWPNCFPTT
jgi:hypothetical protein